MDRSTGSLEQQVSALIDGDGDAATLARVENDPAARALWLHYHQIGDLLRSSALQPLPREHAFMREFQARLAREPAPRPAAGVRWQGAAAALAGLAATLLLALRIPAPPLQVAELGRSLQPLSGVMRAGWQAARAETTPQLLLADAGSGDWTPYLLAHRQLASPPLGSPEPPLPGSLRVWR